MTAVPKKQYYRPEHWLYTRRCDLFLEAAVLPAPLEHDIAPLWHETAPIRSIPSNLAKCTRPSSKGLPAIRKTHFLEREGGSGDETSLHHLGTSTKIDEIGHSAVLSQLLGKWSKSGALAAALQTLPNGGSGYETSNHPVIPTPISLPPLSYICRPIRPRELSQRP